jgi:putative oxidoreductase
LPRRRRSHQQREIPMSVIAVHSKAASHSVIAVIIERLVLLCAIVPYAVVALVLRLVLARVFFLDGQAKIEGTVVPFALKNVDLSFMLPEQIKEPVMQAFQGHYASLPVPPAVTAALFTYAELVLPIFLVLGFATRFSTAALLAITVLTQIYMAPDAFWTLHVYWISMMLVLLTCGPGEIAIDRIIRYVHEK